MAEISQNMTFALWVAAVVSWRPSVAEVVWKGAPAPAFLRLYTTHTRNTIHSLEMEVCIVCVHSIANNSDLQNHR